MSGSSIYYSVVECSTPNAYIVILTIYCCGMNFGLNKPK